MKKREIKIYQDSWINVFVDETGNTDIDTSKRGATNYFICVAIIVEDKKTDRIRKEIESVKNKYFKNGEIKSSKIGSNHKRRLRILKEFENVNFKYFAFVVNKTRIKKDSGLQYKSTFYKFFNRLLYNHLILSGNNINIVADNIGGKSFMFGFENYLKERGKPNLFSRWSHSFSDSKDEPFIQLADLIAGTLTYIYDSNKKSKYSKKYSEILKTNQIGITGWPLLPEDRTLKKNLKKGKAEGHIFLSNLKRALNFISEYEKSEDEYKKMQVTILLKLLFKKIYEQNSNMQNIYIKDLINHLKSQNFPELSPQLFHSKVIGPIRNESIILSGSNKGIKLATTLEDINEYISLDKSIIEPMFYRLKKARQAIKISTNGEIDILDSSEFQILKKLADTFNETEKEKLFKVKEEIKIV